MKLNGYKIKGFLHFFFLGGGRRIFFFNFREIADLLKIFLFEMTVSYLTPFFSLFFFFACCFSTWTPAVPKVIWTVQNRKTASTWCSQTKKESGGAKSKINGVIATRHKTKQKKKKRLLPVWHKSGRRRFHYQYDYATCGITMKHTWRYGNHNNRGFINQGGLMCQDFFFFISRALQKGAVLLNKWHVG